ncbi:hypothetical protein BDR03DRAFT_982439 [Suillus americanus]|nr:hypothetical protein BDR03DRAFT_982439 [Suillus americanus]
MRVYHPPPQLALTDNTFMQPHDLEPSNIGPNHPNNQFFTWQLPGFCATFRPRQVQSMLGCDGTGIRKEVTSNEIHLVCGLEYVGQIRFEMISRILNAMGSHPLGDLLQDKKKTEKDSGEMNERRDQGQQGTTRKGQQRTMKKGQERAMRKGKGRTTMNGQRKEP